MLAMHLLKFLQHIIVLIAENLLNDDTRGFIAFRIIIEEIIDMEDILCTTTKVNALLTIQDFAMQICIIDSGASFHCTPKECFLSFSIGNFGKVYLAITMLATLKEWP